MIMRRSSYPPRKSSKPPRYHRARSGRPPPLVLRTRRPLAAVLVAVDAAKKSGCATYALGKLHAFAQIKAHEHPLERLDYLKHAIKYAHALAVPCGLVVETPWGGSRTVESSLTASVALWRDSWLQLGQNGEHVFEVEAGDWRRALFGDASMPREAQQRIEALTALQVAKRDELMIGAIGSDAAAAICLGATCTHSLELQQVLGCQVCATS